MRSVLLLALFSPALALAQDPPPASDQVTGGVKGVVRLEGDPPPARTWELEAAMRKVSKVEVATDQSWLVGKDKGLANCVVSLHPQGADPPSPKPQERPVKLEKVGWRFVPRVLACTPGTKLLYTNTNSPCNGFQCDSGRQSWSQMVPPGKHSEHVLESHGTYLIRCPLRAYMVAWVRVVKTPYFAVTDSEGRFSIPGVRPGKYLVAVWHEVAGNMSAEAGPHEVMVAPTLTAVLAYQVKLR